MQMALYISVLADSESNPRTEAMKPPPQGRCRKVQKDLFLTCGKNTPNP